MRMLIPADERPHVPRFVLGTTATVIAWAILHDQWLCRVSPDHFLVYHPALFGTQNLTLVAVGLAVCATTGAGMLLGWMLWAAGRLGSGPKAPFRPVLTRLIAALLLIELTAVAAAVWAWWRFTGHDGTLLLPRWLYPEWRLDLVVAQTTQAVTYAVSGPVGVLLAIHVWRLRHRQSTITA